MKKQEVSHMTGKGEEAFWGAYEAYQNAEQQAGFALKVELAPKVSELPQKSSASYVLSLAQANQAEHRGIVPSDKEYQYRSLESNSQKNPFSDI